MNEEQLKQELARLAPQGRISCQLAFELAEKHALSRLALGKLLNQLKIKVINCQLGCF